MATILIVDDRPANREYLVTLLGYGGHRLLQASDGAEALELARTERPDLVIADILMPTMDGYEFVRQLRADLALTATPVIFHTAYYLEREALALAHTCGVSHILTKPCEPEVVLQTVDTVLGVAAHQPETIPDEGFDREHLRVVTDKLSDKVNELRSVNERLNAFIDLNLTLSSELDPRRLIENFCHTARGLVGAKYAAVGILSQDGSALKHYVLSGLDAKRAGKLEAPAPHTAVLGELIRQRRSIRLPNLAGQPGSLGFPWQDPIEHNFLGAPIISPNRTYGWLYFVDKIGAAEFTDEEERLATIIGAQVGRIYENGSLYAEIQQQAQQLRLEIVERSRAESALRESDEKLRLALSAAHVGTWQWDTSTDQVTWSEEVSAIVGSDFGSAPATLWKFLDGVHPEDRPRVAQQIQTALADAEIGDHYIVEYRTLWPSGEIRWVEGKGRVFRDEMGIPVRMAGTVMDITERKSLEAQLLQAQKMEAVGRLAGGIAHDFNNLLTAIIGYSEIAAGRSKDDPFMFPLMDEVIRAGHRAASLTRQLLAFSRKQVLRPEVLDLNALITDLNKMLHRLIGEDIDFVNVLDPGLSRIEADRGQVEQVIMNLVINSRDAMPRGGKLTVETADVELDDSYRRIEPDIQPGHYVMLVVSDTGCGMDVGTMAHVFEPFFTTKEEGKGTGLGLATVYGIVRQSGGHIRLYSEPEIGTTFRIYFPAVSGSGPVIKKKAARVSVPRGSETVLLVEDEESLRKLCRIVLETQGYRVLEAKGPQEAIDLFEQRTDPVPLMITDVVMPAMTGLELAGRLTRSSPELKVLYISGYTGEAIVRLGMLTEDVDLLEKPFSPDALARKVRDILDG